MYTVSSLMYGMANFVPGAESFKGERGRTRECSSGIDSIPVRAGAAAKQNPHATPGNANFSAGTSFHKHFVIATKMVLYIL